MVVLASRSAVRERVPWPNPRLAMLDACRRISSIEVVKLVSRGLGGPSTSHRIFLVLSARHPVDSFICAPFIEPGISNVGNRSMEMRGSDTISN